jgi:hypothetical protein
MITFWKKNSKHSIKSLYSTQIAQGHVIYQNCCYVSSAIIRKYKTVFINKFQKRRKQWRREIILQLSSIRDEQEKVRSLGKRRKHGKNCKYSKNSRSRFLVTFTTLTLSNPFFSANRILPSSYLFWAVKRLVDYL